ncbi:MAG: peptide chain release factor N(5)-glutamine methyltransferase [Thiobacillus sp.]|nr:peptide chain release factor N(5)-glutamine methyltransferase [Thiobacillus sp.]
MNVVQLLDEATVGIAAATGLDKREARLEARVLATHAWSVDPAWLIAHDTDSVTVAQQRAFEALVSQRESGTPIAYLVGTREFYGRSFAVSPDVLIPRPDTELLVDLALTRIPRDQPVAVLDLGTGSGCIALTLALERPQAAVTAVDQSAAALEMARRNAEHLHASVEFLSSDWFAALDARRFDLIVSNPPYIAGSDAHLLRGDVRFEPRSALVAGTDGLDDLQYLVAAAPAHLRPDGWLLLEHGYDQAGRVRDFLQRQAFQNISGWRDLGGMPRVSGGKVSK